MVLWERRGARLAVKVLCESLFAACVEVVRKAVSGEPVDRQARPLILLLKAIESLPASEQDELIPAPLRLVLRGLLFNSSQLRPLAKAGESDAPELAPYRGGGRP